ncbi:hypothetical protein SB861_26390 [Paraburkholderia sp. SIMBA_049]|jgi:hypothetical protein
MDALEQEWQNFARDFRLVIGEGFECTGRARIAFYCGALALEQIMNRITTMPDTADKSAHYVALLDELKRFALLMVGLMTRQDEREGSP